MAIAFCNLISADFYRKLRNSSDLVQLINVCINNICEFLSIIWTFCSIREYNLEMCQVRLFFEGLKGYSKDLRRSNCFLRETFIDLCQKYPVGFKDCISVIENRYFLMLPRINSN